MLSIVSCGHLGFCFLFSFAWMMWGNFTWLLESWLCLNLCLQYPIQNVFWGHLSLAAPRALWIRGAYKHQWLSCSYRKFPQGGSTSSCPTQVPPRTRALGKSRLPGLWIRGECSWANTQGLESHYVFLLKLYPSPPDLSQPGHDSRWGT